MRLFVLVVAVLGCRSEAREPPPRPKSCGSAVDPKPLSRPLAERGKPFVLGVIADTKEPLPPTLDNLRRFAGVFAREKVAAVLALGGLGASEDEIARVLGALEAARAPVLALPGDREPEHAFHAAVARARAAGLDVIDLAEVRVVDGGGFSLVSLPGYPWPHYLGAGAAGCRYAPADVQALRGLFDGLTAPRIFAAHTPPRGGGPDAIDWALGGANVGDPLLARALPDLGAVLGLFAHVDEAGGRAEGLADADGGVGRVAENTWARRLWLNPGSADAVPHQLVAGGISRGQAALVEFSDGKVRYRVIR
jgi:hypothetical protein